MSCSFTEGPGLLSDSRQTGSMSKGAGAGREDGREPIGGGVWGHEGMKWEGAET